MPDILFFLTSRRFLTSRLRSKLPWVVRKTAAREIRVLWYLCAMGDFWTSKTDLSNIGAGQWKTLQYSLPILIEDGFIEEVKGKNRFGNIRSLYKVTKAGKAVMAVIEQDLAEALQEAKLRTSEFKKTLLSKSSSPGVSECKV